ncbi:6028_t:CDS:2 [Funneliformis mosseae]|uniref:6028_t:CDS:1 n=1 Tax=Funneliformis mosseae TaxID=27381 RepID=A0A9N9F0L0_FUNMO|nr:6028_t:CDS:2 [Funneliformis mosseae]
MSPIREHQTSPSSQHQPIAHSSREDHSSTKSDKSNSLLTTVIYVETLQEYIDSKRKAHIKAGSLDQYLQHIQAFGRIKKLRRRDFLKDRKCLNRLPQQPTLINSAISQRSNPFSNSLESIFNSSPNAEDDTMNDNLLDEVLSIDEKISKKVIHVVCFDVSTIPFVVLDQRAKVFLDILNSPDPTQNLRQLYSNVSSANFLIVG